MESRQTEGMRFRQRWHQVRCRQPSGHNDGIFKGSNILAIILALNMMVNAKISFPRQSRWAGSVSQGR